MLYSAKENTLDVRKEYRLITYTEKEVLILSEVW